jgi:hypothetical protein
LISADSHRKLQGAFFGLLLASLALLALLVYFSHRFGRLVSPGCIMFLVAVPGVVVFSMLRGWLENAARNPTQPSEESAMSVYTRMIERLAGEVLPDVVQSGLQAYLTLALIGFVLLLAALIGALVVRARRQSR